jgi:hypothetical protein
MIIHITLDPDTYAVALVSLSRWWHGKLGPLSRQPYEDMAKDIMYHQRWRYLSRKAAGLC